MNNKMTGESPEENFQIEGTVLTKYIGTETRVLIPMYIQGKLISVIGQGAFSHCDTVDYVECSLTTKEIAESAFAHSAVKVVKLQHGVKKIGDFAFAHCPKLMQVIINPDLERLGEGVFTHCPNLVGMKFPNSVSSMGKDTFSHCTKLKYLELPKELTEIPENFLKGCSSLQYLDLPLHVWYIFPYAFACSGLRQLTLPPFITTLGQGAFSHCESLEHITLPDSLQTIGKEVFSGCSRLLIRYIPPNSPVTPEDFAETATSPERFALISSQDYEPVANPRAYKPFRGKLELYTGDYTSVTIPPMVHGGEINSMKQGLFQRKKELVSLKLPISFSQLSPLDFFGCSALEDVVLPTLLKEIPTMCFSECFSLKELALPPYLEKISFSAFSHCRSLTSVAIPESVVLLAEQAFAYNSGLRAVYLPSSLLFLDPDAFLGCEPSLTIYGRRGSLAEIFAIEQGFSFCTVLGDVPELFKS